MRGVIADDGRSKRFHALILFASMSREAGYCSAFQLSHCQRKAALGLASSVLSLHPKSLNCNPDYISVFDGVSWFDRKLTCVMESQGFVARWHGMPGRMLLFAAGPCGLDVVRKREGGLDDVHLPTRWVRPQPGPESRGQGDSGPSSLQAAGCRLGPRV